MANIRSVRVTFLKLISLFLMIICVLFSRTVLGIAYQGGEKSLAIGISLLHPSRLAIDSDNNLWVKTELMNQLWIVNLSTGRITMSGVEKKMTIGSNAGSPVNPKWITQIFAGNKNEILAIDINNRIFVIDWPSKTLTHIAGNGQYGNLGEGGPAIYSSFRSPNGLSVNKNGDIIIADTNNHRVKQINRKTSTISTLAGTGKREFDGDDGPALAASLNFPTGIAIDSHNNIFIADSENNCIRRIDISTGIISTVAGNSKCSCGGDGLCESNGDGNSAKIACIARPSVIAMDSVNNLYIIEGGMHRVRRIDSMTGIITTIAGTGEQGYSGDGELATQAKFNRPSGIAVDKADNLYISDWGNNRVRKVDVKTKMITTIAGNGL